MKNFPWTTHQMAYLKDNYATATRKELERNLAPHTWQSICGMAKRMKARRARDWRMICATHKPVFDFGRSAFK